VWRVQEIILYVAGSNSTPPAEVEKAQEKQIDSLDLSLCWPEDRKESDGSGLKGWENTRDLGDRGHISASPVLVCVCNLRHLQMDLQEA